MDLHSAGRRFSFAVLADPQVGHKDDPNPVPVNARKTLMTAVSELNERNPRPAFAAFLGDLVNVFDEQSVANFEECIAAFKSPSVLVHGNHDTHPPYTDFRALQKRVAGHEEVHFSFDAGQWHFIVIPCNFGARQDQSDFTDSVLAWLESDLKANQERPTMIFAHLHAMPQGLTQLEWYNFPLELRLRMMDLFTKYGNVRYYFNGHVHNGLMTSVKTSWAYKGIRFINAPTIIQARNFGEEYSDFVEGQDAGGYYLMVHVDGDQVSITGHLAGHSAVFQYPDALPEFADDIEPRWFKRLVDLPAADLFVNGDFAKGLDGWRKVYRYRAEIAPGFAVEPRSREGNTFARVFVRAKNPVAWANDENNEIYQLVRVSKEAAPILRATYLLPHAPVNGGGYIRVCAMDDTDYRFLMMFKWGENERESDITPRAFGYALHGRQQGWTFLQDLADKRRGMFWNVADVPGEEHRLEVNIAALHDAVLGSPGAYRSLGVTRLLVAPGVWCNRDSGSRSEAWFTGFSLCIDSTTSESTVDGVPLPTDENAFSIEFGRALREREQKRANRLKNKAMKGNAK